jgi:hypothetical protein
MEEDDLVVLSRDRSTWATEQKTYHDNMPRPHDRSVFLGPSAAVAQHVLQLLQPDGGGTPVHTAFDLFRRSASKQSNHEGISAVPLNRMTARSTRSLLSCPPATISSAPQANYPGAANELSQTYPRKTASAHQPARG